MPNRIIKESICISDDFTSLTWFEQAVFTRLIVTADDYGRTDGRPAVLRGRMFPLEDVTAAQLEAALVKLSTAGMVLRYNVDGKPYLQLCAWGCHQQIRAAKSKFPGPEHADFDDKADSECPPFDADDSTCNQLKSNDSKCARIRKRESISDIRYPESESLSGDESENPHAGEDEFWNAKKLLADIYGDGDGDKYPLRGKG